MTGFVGCLKEMRQRSQAIGKWTKNHRNGVGPCSDKVEPGYFFGPDGGWILASRRYLVGLDFDITMQIKPRWVIYKNYLIIFFKFYLFLLLTKYFWLILAIFLVCYWQSRVDGTTLFFKWLTEPWLLLSTMAVVLLQPFSNLKLNSNFAMGTGTKFMVNTKLKWIHYTRFTQKCCIARK